MLSGKFRDLKTGAPKRRSACEQFTMHRRGQKGDQITDAIARRRTRSNRKFRPSFSNEARPLELEDFASVAMAEVQARNNYKDRAEREAMRGVPTEQICRRGAEQFSLPQANLYRVYSPSTCCSGSLPSSSDILPAVFLNSTNFTYSTAMQSTNPHCSY
uniref:Uncharacterized protein n=1 Tax=Ascaris lumbricoides TaxID=6252 RepID=A0A0M3IIA7_ASCLU